MKIKQNSKETILKKSSKIIVKKARNNYSNESSLLIPSLSPDKKNKTQNAMNFFQKLKKPREIIKIRGDYDRQIEHKQLLDDVVNVDMSIKNEKEQDSNILTKSLKINKHTYLDERTNEKEIDYKIDNMLDKSNYQYYIYTSPGDPIFFTKPCII